jgi:hypothetical protein
MRKISLVGAMITAASLLLPAPSGSVPVQDKSAPGPLSGSWECMSRGGPQGDTAFTLDLSQDGAKVTGSVSSAQGGMEITSGSFKDEMLEIHLDTPDGNYLLTAKLHDGKLTKGETSLDGKAYGTWEGKKGTAAEGKTGG